MIQGAPHGAVEMGLIDKVEDAASRQYTPKIAFVAPPKGYTASSGKESRLVISTCWCAPCPWANCTTL
ncbi:PrpF domain-containing protein [Microbulbifer rhizosphaerae]|nr:PrpF domain-containing protein [Microbulbifer rhizosphaerae]